MEDVIFSAQYAACPACLLKEKLAVLAGGGHHIIKLGLELLVKGVYAVYVQAVFPGTQKPRESPLILAEGGQKNLACVKPQRLYDVEGVFGDFFAESWQSISLSSIIR